MKYDGNWLDEWGSCKVCGGEIPHGHSNNCHIYKLECRIRQLENELRSTAPSKPSERENNSQNIS